MSTTIKLKGRVGVKRLAGKINLVPSENAGGPLQAKTVYPSHSEQAIAPDEDYYGLAVVTVKPVPRVPAAEVGIVEGMLTWGEFVENVVNISTESSVTWEEYYTHFLYNGVRLPRIPDAVLAQYPYAWIRNNTTTGYYDLFLSPYPFYTVDADSISGVDITKPFYRVEIATAESAMTWTDNGTSTKNIAFDSARTILWSNHDIPNGSADATEIYFAGSEPVPTD